LEGEIEELTPEESELWDFWLDAEKAAAAVARPDPGQPEASVWLELKYDREDAFAHMSPADRAAFDRIESALNESDFVVRSDYAAWQTYILRQRVIERVERLIYKPLSEASRDLVTLRLIEAWGNEDTSDRDAAALAVTGLPELEGWNIRRLPRTLAS
jgi:hypothetical protein